MVGGLAALVALSAILTGASPASSPSPSPAPSSAGTSCPQVVPATVASAGEAFGNELGSRAVRRFLTRLESAPPAVQDVVLANAASAKGAPDSVRVARTVAAVCPNGDDVVGLARAILVVSTQWTTRGLEDDKKTAALSDALATRVGALVHASDLAPADLAITAAPFAPLDASPMDAPTTPVNAPSGTCALPDRDAHVIHTVSPKYPSIAIAMRESGLIVLKVSLDDAGFVRSVVVYKGLQDNAGERALVENAIVAAATTTYAPAIVKCLPRSGAYLFQAEFRARK